MTRFIIHFSWRAIAYNRNKFFIELSPLMITATVFINVKFDLQERSDTFHSTVEQRNKS